MDNPKLKILVDAVEVLFKECSDSMNIAPCWKLSSTKDSIEILFYYGDDYSYIDSLKRRIILQIHEPIRVQFYSAYVIEEYTHYNVLGIKPV